MRDEPIAVGNSSEVARLRRGFDGVVLLPGEGAFDEARRVWNAIVDRRPAIIARCGSKSDVATAVRFGRGCTREKGGLQCSDRWSSRPAPGPRRESSF
jgi:hypothetical protein